MTANLQYCYIKPFVDQFFDYFSSAQNEEENMKRVKDFVEVLLLTININLSLNKSH